MVGSEWTGNTGTADTLYACVCVCMCVCMCVCVYVCMMQLVGQIGNILFVNTFSCTTYEGRRYFRYEIRSQVCPKLQYTVRLGKIDAARRIRKAREIVLHATVLMSNTTTTTPQLQISVVAWWCDITSGRLTSYLSNVDTFGVWLRHHTKPQPISGGRASLFRSGGTEPKGYRN